ncbi:MAG: hypothetical protein II600_04890, partial [Bacteroidaceae bacterium]|nr:hypothetical protein [Bacteroidaceae bacterium]
ATMAVAVTVAAVAAAIAFDFSRLSVGNLLVKYRNPPHLVIPTAGGISKIKCGGLNVAFFHPFTT